MSKGKELLNKRNNNDAQFDASSVLGAPILLDNQSDLVNSYLETTSQKEEDKLIEEEIIKNFNLNNNIVEEEKGPTMEEFKENLFGFTADDYYKDYDFDKDEILEILNDEETKLLHHLVQSEDYPENFPNVEQLVKLKIYFKDLFSIQCGNFFEEFHFEIKPEMYICTSLKSTDFFEYKKRFGDEENITLFYPFVLSKCCLFPQIKPEQVFDMPVGTVKKLCENILIKSKYKSSCNVTKL